jgi:hypothetical protein
MIFPGRSAVVTISRERVFILEEVKFVTKQKLIEGPEGTSPIYGNVKVPVEVQTFRCRRYVPSAGNSQSRYETLDFTADELEQA